MSGINQDSLGLFSSRFKTSTGTGGVLLQVETKGGENFELLEKTHMQQHLSLEFRDNVIGRIVAANVDAKDVGGKLRQKEMSAFKQRHPFRK